MPERAHLTSVEALDAFRAALIVYLSKARPALEEVNAQLVRTRIWIEEDQQRHWDHQRRHRLLKLERARNSLSTARMSNVHGASHEAQVDFRRAKLAYDEAESKLRTLKRWSRDFDSRVGAQAKQLERLMDHFTIHLPQAVAFLTQLLRSLGHYTAPPPADVLPRASETAMQPGPATQAREPGDDGAAEATGPGQPTPTPRGPA